MEKVPDGITQYWDNMTVDNLPLKRHLDVLMACEALVPRKT